MNNTGLVSISFRKHSPAEIIGKAAAAGLKYIEWGSDIHAPAGDFENAKRICELMKQNGLETSSYGSYYKLGDEDFEPYVKTAKLLGAPIIRVWAGTLGSAEADESHREACVQKARRISEMAAAEGIKIDFEYHPNTLTDKRHSAVSLIERISHQNCGLYWQPNFAFSHDENLAALSDTLPHVDIIHTFSWLADQTRLRLSERADMWTDFIKIAKAKPQIKYLLEFVKNDDLTLLSNEAQTLREFLGA